MNIVNYNMHQPLFLIVLLLQNLIWKVQISNANMVIIHPCCCETPKWVPLESDRIHCFIFNLEMQNYSTLEQFVSGWDYSPEFIAQFFGLVEYHRLSFLSFCHFLFLNNSVWVRRGFYLEKPGFEIHFVGQWL